MSREFADHPRREEPHWRRAQPLCAGLGAVLLGVTIGGLFGGWPFVSRHVYELVWWSSLALLDGALWWRRGRSPLLGSPLRLAALSLWSVAFWFVFEAVNLRLENWYYIFVAREPPVRWAGSFICFATVLPAEILLADLLGGGTFTGASTGRRGRTSLSPATPGRRLPSSLLLCITALGGIFVALPLIWPRYLFPLVWGSVLLLLEPLNYRAGAFSFLAEIERRNFRPVACALLAGLLLGMWWEGWNTVTRVRWIYTVPFFESWKLFEMPVPGFLGFPPFALECVAVVAALERWAVGGAGTVRRSFVAVLLALAVSCGAAAAVLPAMDRYTVASWYPDLEAYGEIPAPERESLRARGITDGFDLLEAIHRGALRAPAAERQRLADFVELSLLRGIGVEKARALGRLGIHDIADLSRARPATLFRDLATTDFAISHRLTSAEVRVWVRGAREAMESPEPR